MKFKVENIKKQYGKNIVLDSFSYEFKEGLYLLTGGNGVGKSTLLKILAKIIFPTNNNYYIEDLKVAYLCEKVELVNIKVTSFLIVVKKLNKKDENIKELIKKWNIENKNIQSLSKGNKQKIAILLMWLTTSDIYIFDEPTNALDLTSVMLFLELIKSLIFMGKIVIISTHDKEIFKEFSYEEINLKCLD